MPRLALAICALWFVALFLFRSIVQWRRTGSTGVVGFHGRIGSTPWVAGVAATLGLVLASLAPVGALLHWPGGALALSVPVLHVVGAASALAGIAGALLAQLAMGDSWRVGVDETAATRLVTTGLFARVRNPIFTCIGLSLVGLLLLVPNLLALLAGLATAVGIELQVRAVEEPHLERTHGAAYRDYAARVGRFLPGMGRIAPERWGGGTHPAGS